MYKIALVAACMAIGLAQARPAAPVLQKPDGHILRPAKGAKSGPNVAADGPASPLNILLNNQFTGTGQLNAYITGHDSNGAVILVKQDGTLFYPPNPTAQTPLDATDVTIGLGANGDVTTVPLSSYIDSARVYFSAGTIEFFINPGPALVEPALYVTGDPNFNTNIGFAEFNLDASVGLYTDLSYVDYVGLTYGQSGTDANGNTISIIGQAPDAVTTVCDQLKDQATSDGQPWDQLCTYTTTDNTLIRVLNPEHVLVNGNFDGYFDDYADQVFSRFTDAPLTVNLNNLNITGQVDSSGNITFTDGSTFAKPNSADIFSCNSGPFFVDGVGTNQAAIVPILCAAFNRATLLLDGGDVQPNGVAQDQYYTTSPCNHYSRIVHANEPDGRGYALQYDEPTPVGGIDQSGAISQNPFGSVTYYVGGQAPQS